MMDEGPERDRMGISSYNVLTSTTEDIAQDFATNLFGTLAASKAFLPALQRAGAIDRAALVNVLDQSGRRRSRHRLRSRAGRRGHPPRRDVTGLVRHLAPGSEGARAATRQHVGLARPLSPSGPARGELSEPVAPTRTRVERAGQRATLRVRLSAHVGVGGVSPVRAIV